MSPEALADKFLVQLLANLDPAGRAHVEASLTPSARDRLRLSASHTRTRQRDDLIRWLAPQIAPDASATAAACTMETALRRYAFAGWTRHSAAGTRPLVDPERGLHRLLELNDGDVLSARSIRRILS